MSGTLVPNSAGSSRGGSLDELDPRNLPPELKRQVSKRCAIFSPNVKRVLDIGLVHTLLHESVVSCVRFSPDGKYLATGCRRTTQIYDVKSGAKTCVLADGSDEYIRSICFSPDGKLLATGAEDKRIRIWDVAERRIRSIFDGHQKDVYSLDFSPDRRLLVSGSGDKTVRIWNVSDGSSKILIDNDPDSLGKDTGVTSVAMSPNGHFVAAGSLDAVVRIWDVASGVLIERLRGHRGGVYTVAFTPDGKGVVSGSLDKTLKCWDVRGLISEGERGGADGGAPAAGPSTPKTMDFTGHKDWVLSVAVSPDGQWVVSGSKDSGVRFWDSKTATVQCMLLGHNNTVISVDLSPAGGTLATGGGDHYACIWRYGPV